MNGGAKLAKLGANLIIEKRESGERERSEDEMSER